MRRFKGFLATLILLVAANVNAQNKNSVLGDPTNYDQGFRLGFGINGGYVLDEFYDGSLGIDARLQYD
ncbi:MAG TPA: hypothetical protein VGB43_06910, partial [Flavobacterium sp.]